MALSVLFADLEDYAHAYEQKAPDFFTDLNLDQIVGSIVAGRDEYKLTPLFYARLHQVDAIMYRHEVLRDLENQALCEHIYSFAQQMRMMRGHLTQAEQLRYKYQKQSWFLDAVELYCNAVSSLIADLRATDLKSRGLLDFRDYLSTYTQSADFASLFAETQRLKANLSQIQYRLQLKGKRIKVGRYDKELDYRADVLQTFERFKQGATKDYHFEFSSSPDMNHVEAAILDIVAQLYPEIFSSLEEYYDRQQQYVDLTIGNFDREIQFYLACIEHVDRFLKTGLSFCYPTVIERTKEVCGHDVFDLALADKLVRENKPVVTNDFFLRNSERIFVVSGPNQGGKTTFARSFGQLHYLASIGCPVPGSDARLFLFDKMFTHFEREENIRNLSGKLEDELLRIQQIFKSATSDSILIMNESFLSTTLQDALFLSKQIMQQIIERDMLCLTVTFLDELATLSETTVSMTSMIDPKEPASRTFKIVRRPADGLAYAAAIAEKYRLTYDKIRERIAS